MWLLVAASIVAVAVFFERAFYLHRVSVRVGEILRGLANLVRIGNFSEAITECAATPGPVGRVMHSVMSRHTLDRSELKDIAQDSGQLEVPRLERNLGLLVTIVYAAPLIGLLGTVIGLIHAFTAISAQGGYTTAAEIAAGVYQSLLTTAAGLALSVPALLAYQYLSYRVNEIIHDMERAGIEVVSMLLDARRAPASVPATPPSDQPS